MTKKKEKKKEEIICPIIVVTSAYKFYTLNITTIMGQRLL